MRSGAFPGRLFAGSAGCPSAQPRQPQPSSGLSSSGQRSASPAVPCTIRPPRYIFMVGKVLQVFLPSGQGHPHGRLPPLLQPRQQHRRRMGQKHHMMSMKPPLISDGLFAALLSYEGADRSVMDRPPENASGFYFFFRHSAVSAAAAARNSAPAAGAASPVAGLEFADPPPVLADAASGRTTVRAVTAERS